MCGQKKTPTRKILFFLRSTLFFLQNFVTFVTERTPSDIQYFTFLKSVTNRLQWLQKVTNAFFLYIILTWLQKVTKSYSKNHYLTYCFTDGYKSYKSYNKISAT